MSKRAVPRDPPHSLYQRGDAVVGRQTKEFKREGNVVESYQIGQTKIKICDDFVARTPEEIEKVLKNFHAAGWAIIQSQNRKKRSEDMTRGEGPHSACDQGRS